MKLKIGTKVRIKRCVDYEEDSGKVKTITRYTDYFKEQGYILDNEEDKTFLAMDFDQKYNSKKL